MSRVIKFRAWVKDHWIGDKYRPMISDWQDSIFIESVTFNPDDIHVMQFTGLTDKNGVDIYESDVLEFMYDFDDPEDKIIYVVKYGAYGHSGTVGFHCFYPDGSIYDYYGGIPDTENLTVIGNIHQNSDLLK